MTDAPVTRPLEKENKPDYVCFRLLNTFNVKNSISPASIPFLVFHFRFLVISSSSGPQPSIASGGDKGVIIQMGIIKINAVYYDQRRERSFLNNVARHSRRS